jgi:hypothetical protein
MMAVSTRSHIGNTVTLTEHMLALGNSHSL